MKKVLRLEDLDCANCAAKMERSVAKIQGVNSVSVSFINQKMTLDVEDGQFDSVIKEVVKTCKKVEPDCSIIL